MKFFSIRAAQTERTRLEREIQKHDPAFALGPQPFSIGKANHEIDELRETLAEKKGTLIRFSVPRPKAAAMPVTPNSKWAHIHDPASRSLLEAQCPNGPAQLAEKMRAAGLSTTPAAQPSVPATPQALEVLAKITLGCTFNPDKDAALQLWQNHIDLSAVGIADDDARFQKAFRTEKKGQVQFVACERQQTFNRVIRNITRK